MTYARDADRAGGQLLPDWWSAHDDRPLAYVTFGSVAASIGLFPAFYARVLRQLADVPARVSLTLGQAGDPALLRRDPPNVHVERWWPQRDVPSRASVVVGHGGFGTTQAAREAGVPQVVLPLFSFDQFRERRSRRGSRCGRGPGRRDGLRAPPPVIRCRAGLPRRTGSRMLSVPLLDQRKCNDRAIELTREINDLRDVDASVRARTTQRLTVTP